MVYLIFFLLCIIADKMYKKNNFWYKVVVLSIYIFLCFGYMTGSDWRSYEVYYNNGLALGVYEDYGEGGFIILVKIFKYICDDFWIFNGIMKIFYLYALTRLVSLFIKNKWSVIGFSFTFGTMFMLIDCPMRFMIGMSFIFLMIESIIKRKYIVCIVCGLLSLSFHVTMIIPIFIIVVAFNIKGIFKVKSWILLMIYLILIIMSTNSLVYGYLINSLDLLGGLNRFAGSKYLLTTTDSIFTIGTLKNLVLFIFLLYNRKYIESMKHGSFIFAMMCIYFILSPIFINIPTGFRLGILQGYFTLIGFVFILYEMKVSIGNIWKYVWFSIFSFLTLKAALSSPFYYPYTNSIPYIMTEHLPYTYRDNYNLYMYTKLTGNPITDDMVQFQN